MPVAASVFLGAESRRNEAGGGFGRPRQMLRAPMPSGWRGHASPLGQRSLRCCPVVGGQL